MTGDRRDDLLDEMILRRALRLESDERVPPFDADAIAAAAAAGPRIGATAILGGVLLAVAIGLVASAVWSRAFSSGPAIAADVLELALDGLAIAATWAYPVVRALGDPLVPLSLIAGLAIAIHHETRVGRGPVSVEAA